MNNLSVLHFQHMISRGAKHLLSYEKDLNAINVFPVPDGDTGSNLAYLMNMILLKQPKTLSQAALEQIKLACLQGSRGNSGMIFSQFIIAMCDFLKDKAYLNREQFVDMCELSVNKSYQAVYKPMDGTILSVMQDWVSSLKNFKQRAESINELLSCALNDALASLEKTKYIREECRKQNVVDAGAKGFCYFLHGFIEGLTAKSDMTHDSSLETAATSIEDELTLDLATMHTELRNLSDVLEHRYCTEFIVTNVSDEQRLREKLAQYGDSLVFISSQSFCKLHIHTSRPYEIASILQAEGQIMFQKVEDMQRQQDMQLKDKLPIAIVVDSACDLPQHFLDQHHIHMLPLSISVNESHYLDKQTITAEQLYSLMRKGQTNINSSLPNHEQIVRLYKQLLVHYDHVYSLHVSSQLSGTFATCKQIAKELQTERIHVIDSKTLSGAYGLVVKQFAEHIQLKAKDEHLDTEKLSQHLNQLVKQSNIFVAVPSLKSMVASGRLSKTSGKIASLLGLKPIVSIDEHGKSKLLKPVLFKRSNLPQLIKHIASINKKTPIKEYALLYTDSTTELQALELQMIKVTGKKPSYTTTVSSVIGKYAGSGAYSVAIILE